MLWIVAGEVAIDRNHGFDRQTAGLLAAFIAAHAVGDDGETALAQELLVFFRLPVTKTVFVILALAANVGLCGDFESGANFHPSTISLAVFCSIGNSRSQLNLRL